MEHLGSGVPRILESYDRDCFKFSDNFLRMTFPAAEQVTPEVTPQVEQLISVIAGEKNRQEIQDKLNLNDRMNFMNNYLKPAIEHGLIEMTIPDKPNSRLQKYRLTKNGMFLKQSQ